MAGKATAAERKAGRKLVRTTDRQRLEAVQKRREAASAEVGQVPRIERCADGDEAKGRAKPGVATLVLTPHGSGRLFAATRQEAEAAARAAGVTFPCALPTDERNRTFYLLLPEAAATEALRLAAEALRAYHAADAAEPPPWPFRVAPTMEAAVEAAGCGFVLTVDQEAGWLWGPEENALFDQMGRLGVKGPIATRFDGERRLAYVRLDREAAVRLAERAEGDVAPAALDVVGDVCGDPTEWRKAFAGGPSVVAAEAEPDVVQIGPVDFAAKPSRKRKPAAETPSDAAAPAGRAPEPPAGVAPAGADDPPPGSAAEGLRLELLPVGELTPSPNNPRVFAGEDAKDDYLVELSKSIAAVGVLEPILVRPAGAYFVPPRGDDGGRWYVACRRAVGAGHNLVGVGFPDRAEAEADAAERNAAEGWEIIAGECRWRAARLAGLGRVPCIVREIDARAALELTVTENLQRKDLRPLEEARGVASMLAGGFDPVTVADKLGKPLGWVQRRSRIDRLSVQWKAWAADPACPIHDWPATLLELVALLDRDAQDEWARSHPWLVDQALHRRDQAPPSRSELARSLDDWQRLLKAAPWKLDDETLSPAAGACVGCTKRSGCTPGLFDDEEPSADPRRPADRCLDRTCWDRKTAAHVARKEAALREEHGERLVLLGSGGGKTAAGRPVEASHNFDRAKKTDAGARPALVVAGEDAGQVRWVKRWQLAGAEPRPRGPDGKPEKTPLAERRAGLHRRRESRAIELAKAALFAADTPAEDLVFAAVAVYGTRNRTQGWSFEDPHCEQPDLEEEEAREDYPPDERFPGVRPKELPVGPAAAALSLSKRRRTELVARLWAEARAMIGDTLKVVFPHDTKNPWEHARQVLNVFTAAKADDVWKKAVAELPEPKGWKAEMEAERAAKKAGGANGKASPAKRPAAAAKGGAA